MKIKAENSWLMGMGLAVVPLIGQAEWVEWLADARVSAQYDDNLNTSFINAQTLEDFIWSGRLSGGRVYQINTGTRAYLMVQAGGDVHHRFEKLDQYTLGGNLTLTHKIGVGWQVPVLAITGSADEIVSASRLRSGYRAAGQLKISQWLLQDVLQAQLGYRIDHRDADDLSHPDHPELARIPGSVFDVNGHAVATNWLLTLAENLTFNAGYSWRWGDVTSTNLLDTVKWGRGNVRAIHKDDAWPGWVYRAYGTSQIWDAGLNYSFQEGHGLVSAGYRRVDTGAMTHQYVSNQILFSVSLDY